ncbi:hypothetical protein CR105_15130 [Massilia eurypsychrophila]|uniref:BrnT family toxin n=1 Tax=Massilia eurypsychrophila TaxID=1485217 RepID=A0A2G8TEI4_9BURK|nr:BrnT family toxin [Massilia eurypsychrophila]PIL44038.1 hypothetical protein CR105_15130 [Massilia eurypsychrophila]
MRFKWDPSKAAANVFKHLVSFDEAATALSDSPAQTGHGPDHSLSEPRNLTFGVSSSGRLRVVAHTEHGDTVRIIRARLATGAERRVYEEG